MSAIRVGMVAVLTCTALAAGPSISAGVQPREGVIVDTPTALHDAMLAGRVDGAPWSKVKPSIFAPSAPKAELTTVPSGDCSGAPHATLDEDVPTQGTLATGTAACYGFKVQADAPTLLTILSPPEDADFDLYLRFGAPASTTSYDCRPFNGSGTEQCTIERPKAGDWYVMVHAYQGAGTFEIRARTSLCPRLASGVAAPGELSQQGDYACHQILVPEATGALVVDLVGSNPASDLDLILKHGEPWAPGLQLDCVSYNFGSTEQCRIVDPEPGQWFVTVYAWEGSGVYSVTAALADTPCQVLEPGEAATGSISDAVPCFQIDPAERDLVRAELSVDFHDFMFLIATRDPSLDSYEWYCDGRFDITARRNCAIPGPGADTLYFHVISYTGRPQPFSLVVDLEDAQPLTDPVTVDMLEGSFDGRMYRVNGEGGAVVLNGYSDYDLFTRRGGPPSFEQSDCRSTSSGPVESCAVVPDEGPLYVFVHGFTHNGGPYELVTVLS